MTELKEFINHCGTLVDQTLDAVLPKENVAPQKLHQAMRWSLFAGGKRFRPVLVLAVGEVFGVTCEKLLKTAAAIEMIHTFSLIHDDLPAMDDDDLRRGRATCHKKFDEATAILAGDALHTLSFLTIAQDTSLAAEIRLRLVEEVALSTGTPIGMVAGQQLDLEAQERDVSGNELEKIHQCKTGAMIAVSARAAAIIGEADEVELQAVTDYALKLGLLFQITDDLLDVTQTTEMLGKTAGKDITAGKATYPALYGLEEAQNLAAKVYTDAIASLSKLRGDTKILRELAEFILHREK